jgi:hypothetical protein
VKICATAIVVVPDSRRHKSVEDEILYVSILEQPVVASFTIPFQQNIHVHAVRRVTKELSEDKT